MSKCSGDLEADFTMSALGPIADMGLKPYEPVGQAMTTDATEAKTRGVPLPPSREADVA